MNKSLIFSILMGTVALTAGATLPLRAAEAGAPALKSCGVTQTDDVRQTPLNASLLTGTWKGGAQDAEEVTESLDFFFDYIRFKADGTYILVTLSDEELPADEAESTEEPAPANDPGTDDEAAVGEGTILEPEVGTWKLRGNVLTLTYQVDENERQDVPYRVLKLDKNSLVIRGTDLTQTLSRVPDSELDGYLK